MSVHSSYDASTEELASASFKKKRAERIPKSILMSDELFGTQLSIGSERTCDCKANHINCLTAKEWLKNQLGVWQFFYEGRDIRDKKIHPATFPLSLARRIIELFTHSGELVLDPFVGSGTTLVAAQDTKRNAVGFDLSKEYIKLSEERLKEKDLFQNEDQVAVQDDARNIREYLPEESISLIWTSPPYSNLLNRKRRNKSRRDRDNGQLNKVEQYSQDPRDLGTMSLEPYTNAIGENLRVASPSSEAQGTFCCQCTGHVVGESTHHNPCLSDRRDAKKRV